jgi:hypothetical protein
VNSFKRWIKAAFLSRGVVWAVSSLVCGEMSPEVDGAIVDQVELEEVEPADRVQLAACG